MSGSEQSPEVKRHSRNIGNALMDLRRGMSLLVSALDAEEGVHDDAAELIMRMRDLDALARDMHAMVEERVLIWFLRNRHGHRDVVIGDDRYYGDRGKKESVREMPKTFRALAEAELGEVVGAATYGDLDLSEALWSALEGFAASLVSANGLKDGAAKAVLRRVAAERLREELIEKTGIAGAEPTEEDLETYRERLYLDHYVVTWPDKLKDQAQPKKLGVANDRFILRTASDGITKKKLGEMLARAARARERALAAESGGVEVVSRLDALTCPACVEVAGRIVQADEVGAFLRDHADACACETGCRCSVRPVSVRAVDGGPPGSWSRAVRDAEDEEEALHEG